MYEKRNVIIVYHVISEQHYVAAVVWSVAQSVKNLPAKQETWVQFLGQEDSPGEEKSNLLQYFCLENSMDRGARWLQSMGSERVRYD